MSKKLLHIGYPKAGSTFLQKWFSEHPEIIYVDNTLCGFRNALDICEFAYKFSDKEDSCFVTSNEALSVWFKLSGIGINITPINIKQHQKKVCKILKQLYPDAKVLIVTRGYEQALNSFYSEYLKHGGHYQFDEYLALFAPLFNDYFDHNYLINIYENTFDKENILLLPFELLQENSKKFIYKIETFLGLKQFDWHYQKENVSLSDKELYAYRVLSGVFVKLCSVLPEKIARFLFSWYSIFLLYKKLDIIVNCISKIFGQKKIKRTIPHDILITFKKNGSILKNYDIYQPYLSNYLIN
jgi:hypothetical protein